MHMNLSPSLDGDGFIDTVAKPDIIIIIIICSDFAWDLDPCVPIH